MEGRKRVRLIISWAAVCVVLAFGLFLYHKRDRPSNTPVGTIQESEPYGYSYSFVACTKASDREDVLRTYKVDYYIISDDNSGVKTVVRTETVSERICDH